MGTDPTRRTLFTQIGVAIAAATAMAGCLGDDDGSSDQREPSELPSGLDTDGIDVATLRETVEGILSTEAYSYEGRYHEFENEIVDGSSARLLKGDHDARIGIQAHGQDAELLESAVDAANLQVFYTKQSESYHWDDSGPPTEMDEDFEEFAEWPLTRDLPRVANAVEAIGWGSPEWDEDAGRYVVSGTDFSEVDDPPVHEATLHVTADGIPVKLSGAWEGDGRGEVEIEFDRLDQVELPAWVEDIHDET